MENKTIYSKTGKGVLEIKNKAGKLPKDLIKVLSLIDGKSNVADLMAKSKLSDAEINKALSDLSTGGYIKEFANTSTGVRSSGGTGDSAYVDDLDFTSSLSPGKNVYQNAQSEWRQRETADRAKAEQEAKRKREEEERLKKEKAAQQAREEGARLAKVEAERKAKEAAGQKLREEAERKAKAEALAMAQTQRDLSKILDAERKAFELAERKKLEEQQQKAELDAERRSREEAERKIKDDEERRRREEEDRKRKEEEDRKRAEDDRRRREDEERKRKEDDERQRKEAEDRRKREEEERKKREEEDRKRKEEEERKRKEDAERKRREEEERKKREEEERKRKEEEDRKRREEEDRRKREEDERKRKEEEERKRKEEEERIRAEEERKRREEEERQRKEEEERRRREDEERRARREEEDRRRREEDERRRREDEEAARARGEDPDAEREAQARREREDEERRQRDELDRQRREEEDERRRREDDQRRERDDADRRRREDEERRSREEADRRREEESRRKREEEERARLAASAKNDLPEFDLSGLRAMESQVAAEFEKQQEELRKREEEEERHREQEEQARMAMERAEREEQARAEAERRQAEDQERRERMDRERQDREERERKRQEEKEARIREQEEAKIAREQERQRQDAIKIETERRMREEDLAGRRKSQEERDRKRAEVDALKKQKGIRTPLDRLKPVVITLAVLIVVVIGGIQVVPLNSYVPAIEKLASEHIKEPVSIGSMHVSILSGFTINLQNIKLGKTQDVRIEKVALTPEFGSVFADVKVLRKVEVDSATVAEEVLPRLHTWLEAAVADKSIQIDRIAIKSIKLETRAARVTPFDADLQLSPEGSIQKAVLSSTDGKLNLELVPHDNQIDIAMSAVKGWVPPLGPQIEFSDVTLKAVATQNQIRVEKFDALLYGGAARGSAIVNWGGSWSVEGEVSTERINLNELMALFTRDAKSTGQLQSRFRYSLASQGLATLFDSPRIDGNFDIKKGDLDGVDLVRALQSGGRGVTQGGATRFEEISGTMALSNGRYQYRNLKLSSGLLSATGAFEVSPNKDASGRISIELRSQAAQIRGNYNVDGDLKAIVLRPN